MDELNLPGDEIKTIKKQKCTERQINFKSLIKIMNENTFRNPPSQTDLDEDRVQEMVNSYLIKPEYLIFKNKIVIAVLIDQENENLLYLVDGQHRIAMAKKLYHDHDENDYLTLCYFTCYDIKEVEDLFNECNKDSFKNKIVFDKDTIKKIKYNKIKKELKEKYSESFSKTKASANVRYSISEFLDELDKKGYFLLEENLLSNLEIKNKKFNKIIDYLGYLENNSDYFYKEELNCIYTGITFCLKKNNFIDYLMDQSTTPDHQFKNPKSKTNPSLRIQVWNSVFNEESGKCPVYKCQQIITNEANGFMCGFIISRQHNGQQTLDNLRPMCVGCFNRMGSLDWENFIINCKQEYKSTKKALNIEC